MNEKLQQKLFKKYPKIFPKRDVIRHPIDAYGIEHKDGWFDLADKLYHDIQEYVDNNNVKQPECLQQKEKFALLRIYMTNTDSYINNLLNEAEQKSGYICEDCGNDENVTQNQSGWTKTLCEICRKKKKLN